MLRIILAKFTKKRHKFLSSTLYLLGGRIKIEIINLIKSTTSVNESIINQFVDPRENNLLRTLSKEEIECCNKYLIKEIMMFIASLKTEGNKGIVNPMVEDIMANLTREDFLEDYEEMSKSSPDKIYPLEEAHYVILFCLDTIAFIHMLFTDSSQCKS